MKVNGKELKGVSDGLGHSDFTLPGCLVFMEQSSVTGMHEGKRCKTLMQGCSFTEGNIRKNEVKGF